MKHQKITGNYSLFFPVIVFIIMFSLGTSTTVRTYIDDSSGIVQIIKSVHNILFDTSSDQQTNTAIQSDSQTGQSISASDTIAVNGRDPWDLPPAPPPPPTQN